ncbi:MULTISPECIES: hypothetical protein [unclassified Streptomyces]|uniref:hypothetical protein n=1 Tax=unclassified Streptomyces TaxID=2593676 RepID=UPI00224F31C1|nr:MULTISPECIES: hypothetical protein [unclassified Streptomyces]MCX5333478.1 hypothetical protein [Streptomyces sp. NBC_00140]MCX5362948.1 hypothetical protein [Streptomyces sp. NBC_00124]
MSEIAGQTAALRSGATAVVHESYSFACMRCGHGWEQSYEIEHHTGADGHDFVIYVANSQVVPSPLSRPTCQNCDGHVVRIMRPGQVSSVLDAAHRRQRPAPQAGPAEAPEVPAQAKERHHWQLSDLLHPFHHRKAS